MLIPRRVLSALTVCTDAESRRYALRGLRMERDGDKAFAIATDGRRLMSVEWTDAAEDVDNIDFGGLDVKPAADSDFARDGCILSSKDCRDIARTAKPKVGVLKKRPGLEFIALEESSANGSVKLAASDGETTATKTVKPLEGRYPKWRDVLPINRQRISYMTFQEAEANENEGRGFMDREERQRHEELRKATEGVTPDRQSVVRIRVDASFLAEIADAIDKIACDDSSRSVDLIVPIDPSCPVVLEKVTEEITVRAVIMPHA